MEGVKELNGADHDPKIRRVTGPTRRSIKGGWTSDEDQILAVAVKEYKCKNWKKIALKLPTRTDVQCLHRWQKVLNPTLVKGFWTKQEDDLIIKLVNEQQPGSIKWSQIAEHIPGRIGKQCRERWHNHLNPNIINSPWTNHEEMVLVEAHRQSGNKWAELTKILPGRTENAIKNHWNCSLKRREGLFLARETDTNSGAAKQSLDTPLLKSKCVEETLSLNLSLGPIYANSSDSACKPLACDLSKDPHNCINDGSSSDNETTPRKIEIGSLSNRTRQNESEFLSTEMYIRRGPSPVSYCSPPSLDTGNLSKSSSPESILRSAARSFKNIPSIMRKRKLENCGSHRSVEKRLELAFDAAVDWRHQ